MLLKTETKNSCYQLWLVWNPSTVGDTDESIRQEHCSLDYR